MSNKERSYWKWYFLAIVVIFYIIIFFFDKNIFFNIWNSFYKLMLSIIPVLFFVFILMFLVNYFVSNEMLKKYMWEESWLKWWFIAIFWWILSAWPVYAWYPLMQDLQKKWIKNRFLASFLYNRGIKLQWAPVLISYFWFSYSIILLLVMALFSIPQGLIVEKLSKT